nr:hypothetical protein [Gammaproteobacteria bacterium]
MMRSHRCIAWLCAAAAFILGAAALGNDATTLDRAFRRSTLQIATPDARIHRFRIWIADDDLRRARGLMFVKALDDDQGMLFLYPTERHIAMWMKNTFIPLDMVFIDGEGKVREVVANTTPHSLDTIQSKDAVLAVLELKAGTAAKLNIVPGAIVMHEAFHRPP